MTEEYIMSQWNAFARIFAPNDELVSTLNILQRNGVNNAAIQFAGNGWWIKKLY